MEALFAQYMSYATAMALTALTVFAVGVVVVALGQEKRGEQFGG
jgi:cbb3-type cytochrome oxidase subunit 3